MRKAIEDFINKYAGLVAFIFVVLGFSIVIIFLLISPFNDWSFKKDATLFAQYGEFIGGFIGTIFSLAGFFLIYKTLITQQATLEQQDSVSRQERFEITFFNLLKNQSEITNNIKAYFRRLNGVTTETFNSIVGREFFNYSKIELRDIWNSLSHKTFQGIYDKEIAEIAQNEIYSLVDPDIPSWDQPDDTDEKEEYIRYMVRLSQINKIYGIKKSTWEAAAKMNLTAKITLMYNLYFDKYHYVAGHYFRHLYHILDFAETTMKKQILTAKDANSKDEIIRDFRKYVSFIQAQMSSYELMLLYYNCFSYPKMAELIKTNRFLENLAVEDLIDSSHNCLKGIDLGNRKMG